MPWTWRRATRWNWLRWICLTRKTKKRIWDEERPERRSTEPLRTDDESDGSGADAAPSGGSVGSGAEVERSFGDDEQWVRLRGGRRVRDQQGRPERQFAPAEDVDVLQSLDVSLLLGSFMASC